MAYRVLFHISIHFSVEPNVFLGACLSPPLTWEWLQANSLLREKKSLRIKVLKMDQRHLEGASACLF